MIKKIAFEIVKTFVVFEALVVGEKIVNFVKKDISYRKELENYRDSLVNKIRETLSNAGLIDNYDVESEIKDSYIIMKINPKNA